MSFREPVCHGCGRVGTTKRDCEQCSKDSGCRYCHSKTHGIKDCPRIKPCQYCNIKGHKPSRCPQVTGRPRSYARTLPQNLRAPQPSCANSSNALREATTRSPALGAASFSQQSLSVAVPTVPHDDDEWKKMSEEVRNVNSMTLYLFRSVSFSFANVPLSIWRFSRPLPFRISMTYPNKCLWTS